MSASMYRGQWERKGKQKLDAEKKVGDARSKESAKRAAAAKARADAAKASSSSTAAMKLRQAKRVETEAERAGKDAGQWQQKASRYAKEESDLQVKMIKAERFETEAAERRRKRDDQQEARRVRSERAALNDRVGIIETEIRELRAPKAEKLRVLLLGAASDGDLRVSREQKRIRSAVEAALHRDYIEIDARPAATAGDLLDGITKFRPHVVHFSGHSGTDVLEFEDERDEPHAGVKVTASAFAAAVKATDDPPLLIVMNSCDSASQLQDLIQDVAPFAIGMSDEIDDIDAIVYAAQFYAAIANGQSIQSAHNSGRAALKLAGLSGAELPTLLHDPSVDPGSAVLVRP